MNLHVFFGLIFLTGFVVSGAELPENRTFARSRYSLRNRKDLTSTTKAVDSSTTENPNSMEVVVESQTLRVANSAFKKFERAIAAKKLTTDDLLTCGGRHNNDTPWIAVIEHRDPTGRDNRKTLSKGVLISARHVLTTVSSIHNTHPFWVVTHVRLGDAPTWANENIDHNKSSVISMEIDKVYQHSSKDIAIIRMKEPVKFGDTVQPICLPINENYKHPELFLHICKKRRGSKRHIDLVSVKPLSPQDCSTMFHRKSANFTDGEFCAWDEYGDTCTGDVGGPLLAKFYGKFMVIGLNSFVLTKQEFDATDYPGVYVNVGYYIKWIDDIVSIRD